MVPCPQSPPPSRASYYSYPSPRSKSPPSATPFKGSRKLPIPNYPLTDITNLALAQASALELSNLTPILADNECSDDQVGEVASDAPRRKRRGKNRRGRSRGIRAREVGGSLSAGAVLRSPILMASSPRPPLHAAKDSRVVKRKFTPNSPNFSTVSLHESHSDATTTQSPTPPRGFPLISAPTPETPRHGCKRQKRWSSPSPRGNPFSPPSPPSPPRPMPTALWLPRSHKPLPNTSGSPRQFPTLPLLRFPAPPPPSTPGITRSSHSNIEQQLSLLPAMNLGSAMPQRQVRKKLTKRELADVQWQITMHKSLAWRTTRDHFNALKPNVYEQYIKTEAELSHEAMDSHGGPNITFERPASPCADGNEPDTGSHVVQSHWTDSLDRELVKRLWVKLIAQGCRTIPVCPSNRPKDVHTPFPTIADSQSGVPFPSGQSEQPLAPAIQLPSNSYPTSEPQVDPGVPQRRRVSAITSSLQPQSHMSTPYIVSSQKPSTISMLPASSFTADPTHPDSYSRMSRIPRKTLSPRQLAAQAILRHYEARSKPIRRGCPPVFTQKGSPLRREIIMEYAE
ncbi:hypothetical protein JB92DRAFT_2828320 [Gautieria morchelliformis]|nr:hypothetical protein JB92DRAFT_2828320 [Gautieria morchelliformis]